MLQMIGSRMNGSLGILCWQAGKLEDSAEYFQQAVRVNPDDALAQKYLELIRVRLKR